MGEATTRVATCVLMCARMVGSEGACGKGARATAVLGREGAWLMERLDSRRREESVVVRVGMEVEDVGCDGA
jgi:hypothetical protein